MFENISLLGVSILLLWFSADWIVDSAAAIARKYDIPELVIGLTIVAFGTSAPEFLVTFSAALKGLGDISLSNVVGSNFLNLGVVLGSVALIRPVEAGRTVVRRDGPILLAVTAFVLFMTMLGSLGRLTGIVLFGGLLGYIYLLIKMRDTSLVGDECEHRMATWLDYPKLVAGFAGVSLGGSLLVDVASELARSFGVSEWFIGLTIVAFGTSLPELVTSLAASIKGRNNMLLGNLIGSNLFNFAGVLGLTCIINPLQIGPEAWPNIMLNLLFVGMAVLFMRTGWKISRKEGAALLLVNIAVFLRDFIMN